MIAIAPESSRPNSVRLRTVPLAILVLVFALGICVCAFGAQLLHLLFGPSASDRQEELRATSPGGRFDAVMTREGYGGAVGGFTW
jgi:hypothetical protein